MATILTCNSCHPPEGPAYLPTRHAHHTVSPDDILLLKNIMEQLFLVASNYIYF